MDYQVTSKFILTFTIPVFVDADSAEDAAEKALDAACESIEQRAAALGGMAGSLDVLQQFVEKVG